MKVAPTDPKNHDPADASDEVEEFEEVVCENECKTGFRVLLGRDTIVLICAKCRLEYDLSHGSSDA